MRGCGSYWRAANKNVGRDTKTKGEARRDLGPGSRAKLIVLMELGLDLRNSPDWVGGMSVVQGLDAWLTESRRRVCQVSSQRADVHDQPSLDCHACYPDWSPSLPFTCMHKSLLIA